MNQKGFQAEVFLFTLGVMLVGGAVMLSTLQNLPSTIPILPQGPGFVPAPPAEPIPTFASCSAIKTAFEESASKNRSYGYGWDMMKSFGGIAPMMAQTGSSGAEGIAPAPSYSKTNVQVEGVDEADIVKTDGTFIYTLSGNSLTISQGYPSSDAKLLSKTKLEEDSTASFSPQEMFIDGDYVLVFGQGYRQIGEGEPIQGPGSSGKTIPAGAIMPYPYYRNTSLTIIQVWSTANKEQPQLVKTAEFEGGYVSSRKINSQVFFVLASYPQYWLWDEQPVPLEETEQIIPVYREKSGSLSANDAFEPVARCGNIGYLPPIQAQNFITIGSFAMNNPSNEIQKQTVVGNGENVYASQSNLYVASTQWDYQDPTAIEPLNEAVRPFIDGKQFTQIHKFSLLNNQVSYLGSMKAPGHILNQFSMDEFENHFRIATTIGEVWDSEKPSTNNVYIFDDSRNQVGKLEDLAPGEKIYSVRFMGKKGYLVTFKKVDPLFVIDLAEPANPRVLGKLKIPGYSDYLHSFDETHIIGIGKEAIDAEQSLVEGRGLDFAWYQGLKIALFDVSDVANPKEMYKVVIGDRGTESEALHDHKAFLFDREKQLLVIPVTLAEISSEERAQWEAGNQRGSPPYGSFTFQGAFVYNLSLENGFQLKGRITHDDSGEQAMKSGYYYGDYGTTIRRSLYIDNVLYTVSDSKIKLNQLSDLSEIKSIGLGEQN